MNETARRTLAALTLVLLLGACTAASDLGQLIDRAVTPAATTPPSSSGTAVDDATRAAIQQVIQRANDAQRQALAQRNPELMRDTSTAQHYDEMVRVNADLANGGVTAIELLNIRWDAITVDGPTAQATTYETWRSTYADGATEESTDRNDYKLVRQDGTWRIQAVDQPEAQTSAPGGSPPGQTQPGQPATPAVVRDTSSNWSGYAAAGGTFTAVSGTWIVPQVTAAVAGADATWIGIGGVSGRDLIQAGTQATVSGGRVVYEAWIEMLPDGQQTVPLNVRPGDSVSVTITERSTGTWSISLKDDTTGQTYSTSVRYASSKSSAEWIEEAPSGGRSIVPLDNFGTIRFTAGATVKDGKTLSLSAANAQPITMINGARQPIAQPSTLGSDGASFTVTRTDNLSTPATGPSRRRRG